MMISLNDNFNRAKEALLKYYSEVQVSLGARLIGLSVALFALLEAFKNFNADGLSLTLYVNSSFSFSKIFLFFFGILLLTVLMVRSIFRYATISGYCNKILVLPPFEEEKDTVIHAEIAKKAYQSLFNDKGKCTSSVFYCFPSSFFLEGERGKIENKDAIARRDVASGWIWSIVVGIIITFALLALIG